MRRWKRCGAALAPLLVASCVGVTPTLPNPAKPGAAAGYVAGFLSRGDGEGVALELVGGKSGRAYMLDFEHAETARPQMIEVPPGTYRVASWVTFNFARERVREQEVPAAHVLARPFTIGAGQVVVLGALEATTTVWREPAKGYSEKFTKYWEVLPKRITEAVAVAGVREAFPGFAAAPVTCLLCAAEGEPEPKPPPRRKELQLTPPTLQLQPPPAKRIGG